MVTESCVMLPMLGVCATHLQDFDGHDGSRLSPVRKSGELLYGQYVSPSPPPVTLHADIQRNLRYQRLKAPKANMSSIIMQDPWLTHVCVPDAIVQICRTLQCCVCSTALRPDVSVPHPSHPTRRTKNGLGYNMYNM
jgi:hypothetical protein